VVSEFIQLQRADADKTAELLNKLLQGTDQPGAPPGAPNPAATPTRDLEGPAMNEHHLISGSAQIVSDERSNRLLVVTRPSNLPFLHQLIGDLDEDSAVGVPQRRDLKYVMAGDILPALEAALAEGKDEEDQSKQDQGAAGSKSPASTASETSAPVASSASNGGQGTVSAITPSLSAPSENNVPSVVEVGKTRILADNRANSIIVFGTPDATARVFAMIDELDRKPLQVYLATVIGELTVSNGLDFGIDILQKFQHVGSYGLASGLVTPNTTSSAQVPEPGGLLSSTGFPLPTGLTLYGAIGNTLNAYVRALETTNRFRIISRPSVYTTNNKLAVIASGSQVPVPSNTTSGFTGSNTLATTSSITYEDVLLQLDIIPLINADHQVTLKIRQTNNTLGSSTVISGNSIPSINTQEINTEVTVPDKSTVVIGGLISDNTTRTTSGLPWLSDIPILGYLFKETDKSKTRNELIIMIQPTVIATDADQIASDEAEKRRTILGVEAAQAAVDTVPEDDGRTVHKVETQTTTRTAGSPSNRSVTTSTTTTTVKSSGSSVRSLPLTTPTASPDVAPGRMPKDAPASPPPTLP
jgi:type II secretion system protein D